MATRPESFLPPGASESDARMPFPKLATDPPSIIISPLTLPRGLTGYFDQVSISGSSHTPLAFETRTSSAGPAPHNHRGGQVYSPLSPGLRGPAVRAVSSFSPSGFPLTPTEPFRLNPHRASSVGVISPRAAPSTMTAIHDSAPDARRINGLYPMPIDINQFVPPMSPDWAGRSLSVPLDSPAAPVLDPDASALTIQRLTLQNARIRDAWEAERKHLEANRERAEEVYKEERVIMEEERSAWEVEKKSLLAQIECLERLVLVMSSANAMSPTHYGEDGLVRGGTEGLSQTTTTDSWSSHSSIKPPLQRTKSAGVNGASPSPKPALGIRELASPVPVSPNGPSRPVPDFLKPAELEIDPIPVVDVQQIHPELEGIRIKASTVKKTTFTDPASSGGSKTSSRAGSPSMAPDQLTREQGREQPDLAVSTADETSRPSAASQPASPQDKKQQTLKVLAADEVARLTMHAGHTPSHSLSALGTVVCSATSTQTSTGGTNTPTMPQGDGAPEPAPVGISLGDSASQATVAVETVLDQSDAGLLPLDGHPEPILEPSHDKPLTGPLMVRNMPAHDEIFFQALNDKLEEVSKDEGAAVPAVLKNIDPAAQQGAASEFTKQQTEPSHAAAAEPGQSAVTCQQQQPAATADEFGSESDRCSSSASGDIQGELDVPLKFKRSTNFGAPLGEAWGGVGIRGTRPSVVQNF